MRQLAVTNSGRYSLCNIDEVNTDEITVFIRDPIIRYSSGLLTQIKNYKIPKHVIANMLDEKQLSFIDLHTIPQFWFLMAVNKEVKVRFNIKPMSELNQIDGITWRNKTQDNSINFSAEVIAKLNHFYTEDIVLYNQFLNTTSTVDEIVDKILLEKSFIDDLSKYKSCLTQYFKV